MLTATISVSLRWGRAFQTWTSGELKLPPNCCSVNSSKVVSSNCSLANFDSWDPRYVLRRMRVVMPSEFYSQFWSTARWIRTYLTSLFHLFRTPPWRRNWARWRVALWSAWQCAVFLQMLSICWCHLCLPPLKHHMRWGVVLGICSCVELLQWRGMA